MEAGLVVSGLAVFVAAVYGTVVLLVQSLWMQPGPPNLVLSVLATMIVALGFSPAQARVHKWAARVMHTEASSPYEILRRVTETVGGGYPSAETPARIAKALSDGTHAQWAQTWLDVSGRLVLAATFPPTSPGVDWPPQPVDRADDASGEGLRALVVRYEGEALGVLRLQQREHTQLSAVEERLFRGLASQAGLVLKTVRLEAELSARIRELSERSAELSASRQRLIEAQDAERMRLERDIHDGAQQHLVALTVNLELASSLVADDPDRAAHILDGQREAAQRAVATLSQLARGIYPRMLVRDGLVAALREVVSSGDTGTRLTAAPYHRQPPEVEEALYFCCLEALQNASKHAQSTKTTIHAGPAGDAGVEVTVEDNGHGFDVTGSGGGGIANMRDRIDAIGGQITITSAPAHGTRIDFRFRPLHGTRPTR